MSIEPAFGTFGSVGRCQFLLENEIGISIKLVSRRKHDVPLKCPWYSCFDCGLQKTQWTNTSRWHGSPNNHWLCKLHTGLQQHGFCAFPSFSRTRDLDFQWNAKFTLIWKEDFGPLRNSHVLFLFSPGRRFWRCFCFRSGLVNPFSWKCLSLVILDALTPASVHSLWSSPKCLNQLCLTVFWNLKLKLKCKYYNIWDTDLDFHEL